MPADDESGEKSVSVLLSGEESELVFIDHPSTEISVSVGGNEVMAAFSSGCSIAMPCSEMFGYLCFFFWVWRSQTENCLSSYDPHGYCVIYSSADRESFIDAERVIQALWTSDNIAQRAVILVGNKADLARSRVVSLEGKKQFSKIMGNVFGFSTIRMLHSIYC